MNSLVTRLQIDAFGKLCNAHDEANMSFKVLRVIVNHVDSSCGKDTLKYNLEIE